MQFLRTANAGGLLEMDGVRILLDGVSPPCRNYEATPKEILDYLFAYPPDVAAYTHIHSDHFSSEYATQYSRGADARILLGGEDLARERPEILWERETVTVGTVRITPTPSRHIGKAGNFPHRSYLISGSSLVWFLGDASPVQWRTPVMASRPGFLIAPFAYALTEAAWRAVELFSPDVLILVHLPERTRDDGCVWPAVKSVTERHPERRIAIPKIGETVTA